MKPKRRDNLARREPLKCQGWIWRRGWRRTPNPPITRLYSYSSGSDHGRFYAVV